jgi:glycosyltransferase 2 family protein
VRGVLRHAGKLLACVLSLGLIALAVRGVEWGKMGEAFRQANYTLVLAGALVGLGGFVVRGYGWKFLLAPVGRFDGWRLFPPVAIGYMANNLFPARLGEFVRAYVVGKREGVSKSSALATIIIERIFDGLTLLLILAVVSVFFHYPPWVQRGGWIVAGIFLGLSAFLAVVSLKLALGLRLLDATLGRFLPATAGRMKRRLECFVVGLDVKNHWRDALCAFAACLFRWSFEACIYLSVVAAMGLADRVPVHGALFVMVTVNIACMVPSGPAYVGPVQFACVEALGVFGIEHSQAFAFSLLLHAAIFFPITIVGIACAIHTRLGLKALRQPEAAAPEENPERQG